MSKDLAAQLFDEAVRCDRRLGQLSRQCAGFSSLWQKYDRLLHRSRVRVWRRAVKVAIAKAASVSACACRDCGEPMPVVMAWCETCRAPLCLGCGLRVRELGIVVCRECSKR